MIELFFIFMHFHYEAIEVVSQADALGDPLGLTVLWEGHLVME